MAITNNQVAEMQGLYGPFTLAERVVQKIWWRGDFDRSRARLADGRRLEIRSAGTWNRLGGPDFHGARLVIGGRELTGDIEVHFHASDWRAHGHQSNRAYHNVALHVVMFPPGAAELPALGGDGTEIPLLVLLPLLHRDLEEYASDDALETLTARGDWERFAELAAKPPAELRELIREHALNRWRQKVRYATLRIEKLGWPAATHQTALEILGYRHNRAAMLAVAARHPLEAWGAELDAGKIIGEGGVSWQTQGVRPANHPLTRLRQYQQWVAHHPDWPQRLRLLAGTLPEREAWLMSTKLARTTLALAGLRTAFADDITGGAVGSTRLDNLVCDGFLPLLAAQTGRDLSAVWFHWFLGDIPVQVRAALPKLGVAGRGAEPLCHGWAQGLLGWILQAEVRASR